MPNKPAPIFDAEVIDELMGEWGAECGRRLRQRRKQLGLSLVAMGGLTGLSHQTIHRAEYDGTTVRDGARHLIAAALGGEVLDFWQPFDSAQLRRRAKAVS